MSIILSLIFGGDFPRPLTTYGPHGTQMRQSFYGGDQGQPLFQTATAKAIGQAKNTAQLLDQLKALKGNDVCKIFTKLIQGLGVIRHELAKKATPGWDRNIDFGFWRAEDPTKNDMFSHISTPLTRWNYTPWNTRTKNVIAQQLENLRTKGQTATNWMVDKDEETCFKVEVLNENEYLPNNQDNPIIENALDRKGRLPVRLKETANLSKSIRDLNEVVNMASANDDGKANLAARMAFVQKIQDDDGLRLIRLSMAIKYGDKFLPSTKHFGWIETCKETAKTSGLSEQNIKQFMDEAWLTCTHTPAENIQTLIDKTAGCWEHAIQWTADRGTDELIQRIGAVHYLLDNIMPFNRGSAAVAEWVATSLFNYQGFDVSLKEGYVSVVQESLANPSISDFKRAYAKMLSVTPRAAA